MKKTWTRNDLMEAISENVGVPLNESSNIIENIFDFILKALEDGEDVKISSFGTFKVKHKNSRIGRNPKTGAEAEISGRRVITFRPSQRMKDRVNNGNK